MSYLMSGKDYNMKHLKRFNESFFVTKSEVDELLDKISSSGITSLSDIEKNRLSLFSEEDKEIIEVIEKMADITNKFSELNKEMSRLTNEGKTKKHDL